MRGFLTKYEIPIYAVILAAALFCFAVGMSGCSAPVRLAKIGAKHPHAAAVFCADRFPSKDSFSVVREYIRGRDSVRVDSVMVDCGEISQNELAYSVKTRYVKAACPPCVTRVDTMVQETFKQVENTGKTMALTMERDSARQEVVKQKTKKTMAYWAAGIGWFLILTMVAIRVFKPKLL